MTNRASGRLLGLTAVLLLVTAREVWAGGAGGGPGDFSLCRGGPSAALECTTNADCPGSTCVTTTFLPTLPRFCKGGPNAGGNCYSDDDCLPGRCTLAFEVTQPSTIPAILTLIVDDEETNLSTGQSCGAATILLEVTKDGQHYLLPQTYLCIPQADPELDFLRTEAGLNDAVADTSLLNRLLFRGPDAGPDDPAFNELAQELRTLFGTIGQPIVVGTPQKIADDKHTNNEANGLGSAVRLQIQLRFVQE
jgi:hypothetical protein